MEPHDQRSVDVRAALDAAVAGDSGALGDLLETLRPRLERTVAFRLDRRLIGRLDAGDVLQEAFEEVLRRLPEYLERSELDFFVWVRLTTGQKLTELHRRHLGAAVRDAGREASLGLHGVAGASSVALAGAILDPGGTPSQAVATDERAERLRAAIEGMEEIDREVLCLRHFEQLTNREVAQVLGLTEPAATQRHTRALLRLRAILERLKVVSEALP